MNILIIVILTLSSIANAITCTEKNVVEVTDLCRKEVVVDEYSCEITKYIRKDGSLAQKRTKVVTDTGRCYHPFVKGVLKGLEQLKKENGANH